MSIQNHRNGLRLHLYGVAKRCERGPEILAQVHLLKRRGAMRVLGIETTCDETAVSVVESDRDGEGRILSNEILSQIKAHQAYGGVVPEIAARAHIEVIDILVKQALLTAGMKLSDMDGIAAAAGPGLIGGVMVGLTTGKALSLVAQKPFLAVNHLEAHALSPRLTDGVDFPFLLLLASGGHSQLLFVRGVGDYVRLGSTIDDAIGEAFDKVAKMLGLPYPGGPVVERLALEGNPEQFAFPRPMQGRKEPDFSLSGLKTAVRIEAEKIAPLTVTDIKNICASFQAAIVDVVADRTKMALKVARATYTEPKAIVIAGGVAANLAMRRALQRLASDNGLPLVAPPVALCTDNGAMIAWAGIERLRLGLIDGLDFAPRARWALEAKVAIHV